jgi:hypothetical protein
MALLGVSRTTYGTFDANEKRWKETEIEDAIIDADVEFQRAICETDKHPRRIMFYQAPVAVAQAALIPAHTGPIGPVQITYQNGELWPGIRTPAEWIRAWADDQASRTASVNIAINTSVAGRNSGWRFTQSDVGKTISIAGAGTGGPLVATILTVDTFLQSITVSSPAIVGVTGATATWTGNDTYGGPEATEGHWDVVEDRVYFLGTTFNLTVCEVSRGTNNPTTGLLSPLECINGIKGMALGTLFAKDSIKMDAAQYYAGYANMCLGLIREGKMTFPPLMQFETGRTD